MTRSRLNATESFPSRICSQPPTPREPSPPLLDLEVEVHLCASFGNPYDVRASDVFLYVPAHYRALAKLPLPCCLPLCWSSARRTPPTCVKADTPRPLRRCESIGPVVYQAGLHHRWNEGVPRGKTYGAFLDFYACFIETHVQPKRTTACDNSRNVTDCCERCKLLNEHPRTATSSSRWRGPSGTGTDHKSVCSPPLS